MDKRAAESNFEDAETAARSNLAPAEISDSFALVVIEGPDERARIEIGAQHGRAAYVHEIL